jgi:Mlc titration factor MtfA (ptsG expression regulator)
MLHWFKRRRRAALRVQPLTPSERAIVERNVPYVAKLSEADRAELDGLVRIFLAEKAFEGCGGLVLTEEIRVTIAVQACILLLHRETDIYPDVDAILVLANRSPRRVVMGAITHRSTNVRGR